MNQPSTSAVISVVSTAASTSTGAGKNAAALVAYAVHCPTCEEEFCSACKKTVSLGWWALSCWWEYYYSIPWIVESSV